MFLVKRLILGTMGESILILTIATLGIVVQANCMTFTDQTPTLKCVPNRLFIYDHNICYCNEDGTKLTCKRKMYSTLTPDLHLVQLQNLTLDCVPERHFKVLNQDCICHESGKFASCVQSRNGGKNSREKCIPGAVFQDNCNGCICGTDGKATCTRLDCNILASNSEEPKATDLQCVPGSELIYQCNDCSCTDYGTSMLCNKMGCGTMSLVHEHVLNVTMNCEANSTFDYNCHQCICDAKGNYAMCSGKECPRWYDFKEVKDTAEKCNPGMIFASDCNICICAENGQGVCTTFSCDTTYQFKYFDKLSLNKPRV